MLIGGFEQKVALVVSEININTGGSIRTHGTRSGKTSERSSSKSSGKLRSTEGNLASRHFLEVENTSGNSNEEDSQS